MKNNEIESLLLEVEDIQFLGFRVFYPSVLSLSLYFTHLKDLRELILEWPDHDQYIPRDLMKIQFYHRWLEMRVWEEKVEEAGEGEGEEEVVEEGIEEEEEEAKELGMFMEPFNITFLTDIESREKFGTPFSPFELVR